MTTFTVPSSPQSPVQGTTSAPMQLVPITPPYRQTWGIFTTDTFEPVFDFDTMVDFKFADVSKVSSFPTEQGAFASYNKVVEAYQPKVKIAVGGQDRMNRLMDALQSELRTTNLYNVVTPEYTYMNVTLEKYDYNRSQKAGRNLLQVEITFMQVIQVAPAYSKTKINHPKRAVKAKVMKPIQWATRKISPTMIRCHRERATRKS